MNKEEILKLKLTDKEVRQLRALAKKTELFTIICTLDKVRVILNKEEYFKAIEFNTNCKIEKYFNVASDAFLTVFKGTLFMTLTDSSVVLEMSESDNIDESKWSAYREISILNPKLVLHLISACNVSQLEALESEFSDMKRWKEACNCTGAGISFNKQFISTDSLDVKIFKVKEKQNPREESYGVTKEALQEIADFGDNMPVVSKGDFLVFKRGNYILGVTRAIVKQQFIVPNAMVANTGIQVDFLINLRLAMEYLTNSKPTPKQLEKMDGDNYYLLIDLINNICLVQKDSSKSVYATPMKVMKEGDFPVEQVKIPLRYFYKISSLLKSEVQHIMVFPRHIQFLEDDMRILIRKG